MKKIMVVDDELELRELIAERLKKNGYDARAVSGGKEALASAKNDPADLIMLDVAMPDMDGYETCRRLKEENATKDIPVVFLSGKDLDPHGIVKRAAELGARGYILKPSTFDELLEKVKEIIG